MTLLFVILLDVGVILVISAFENTPLKQTFSDILNNTITPASSSADNTPNTGSPAPTPGNPVLPQTNNPPVIRRTL